MPEESELAPTGTTAPEPTQQPEFSAPNPEDAVHAERELEMRGGSMSEPEISALLHERLVWVTATGRSVSRADTIAYRARAFTQQGSPAKQGVQVVDDHNVLIMAAVQTARGRSIVRACGIMTRRQPRTGGGCGLGKRLPHPKLAHRPNKSAQSAREPTSPDHLRLRKTGAAVKSAINPSRQPRVLSR